MSNLTSPIFRLLFSMTVALLMVGCGGGSGGGDSDSDSSGSSGGVTVAATPTGILYVSSRAGGRIASFGNAENADGILPPRTLLEGTNTLFNSPGGLAIDAGRDHLYVAGFGSNIIHIFHDASTATGNTAPDRTISTNLNVPKCVSLDTINDRMFVLNNDSIGVYDSVSTLDGAVAPNRSISALPTGSLGCYYDVATNRLYISILNAGIFIYDNASTANDTHAASVSRSVAGALTGLVGGRGVFVDSADRLYVSEQFASDSILVFDNASTVNGDVAPSRTLSGAQTMLFGAREILINPVTDELFVANSNGNNVLVFANASTINGDVAPVRTLSGAATLLNSTYGIALDITRQ
jgi:DNA-binding beta-propeller fold protein YncE